MRRSADLNAERYRDTLIASFISDLCWMQKETTFQVNRIPLDFIADLH